MPALFSVMLCSECARRTQKPTKSTTRTRTLGRARAVTAGRKCSRCDGKSKPPSKKPLHKALLQIRQPDKGQVARAATTLSLPAALPYPVPSMQQHAAATTFPATSRGHWDFIQQEVTTSGALLLGHQCNLQA